MSSEDRALRAWGRFKISFSTPPVWALSSRGGDVGAFMASNVRCAAHPNNAVTKVTGLHQSNASAVSGCNGSGPNRFSPAIRN